MSACFVLQQSDAVHMIVDSAVYLSEDFTLTSVNANKATALATLPTVISCTGHNDVQRLLADAIEQRFETFDALVANGPWLNEAFRAIAEERYDGDATSSIYAIGWLSGSDQPGAFSANLWTDGPAHRQWLENSADIPGFEPAQVSAEFQDISSNITGSPMPDVSKLDERCFAIRAPDDYLAEVDLLHIIEGARHKVVDGKRAVGGKAVLSTVDRSGIRQRVLHHWKEDRIGECISAPEPEWRAYRREIERRFGGEVAGSLSPLKRAMMEKKARKGILRSVK